MFARFKNNVNELIENSLPKVSRRCNWLIFEVCASEFFSDNIAHNPLLS